MKNTILATKFYRLKLISQLEQLVKNFPDFNLKEVFDADHLVYCGRGSTYVGFHKYECSVKVSSKEELHTVTIEVGGLMMSDSLENINHLVQEFKSRLKSYKVKNLN